MRINGEARYSFSHGFRVVHEHKNVAIKAAKITWRNFIQLKIRS